MFECSLKLGMLEKAVEYNSSVLDEPTEGEG